MSRRHGGTTITGIENKQNRKTKNDGEENKGDVDGSGEEVMETGMKERGGLTGNGAEVEVVSNNLLVVVVHWALGEAQVEVVPQILVNHPP